MTTFRVGLGRVIIIGTIHVRSLLSQVGSDSSHIRIYSTSDRVILDFEFSGRYFRIDIVSDRVHGYGSILPAISKMKYVMWATSE